MTRQQIKNKIENLDTWLKDNPNHASRHLVLNDKRALELELSTHEANDIEVNNPEILE